MNKPYDDKIKPHVLRMNDGGATVFRTDVFVTPGAEVRSWLEAWKNPATNLWTVERHDRMANQHPKKNELQNACFFDAVNFCAQFEVAEKFRKESAPAANATAPHYRAVAEDAGVPFDLDSLPHPAAFGRILTDGHFDDHARAIAAKTRTVKKPADLPGDNAALLASVMPETDAATSGKNDALLEKGLARQKLVADFRDAASAAMHLGVLVEEVTVQSFRHSEREIADLIFFNTMGLVVLAPLWLMPLAYMAGDKTISLHRAFDVARKNLDQKTTLLPDCEEKTLLQDFSKASAVTFSLEEAAAFYKVATAKKKKEEKLLKKSETLIDRAFVESGRDPAEAGELKAAWREKRFPAPGSFHEKLKARGEKLQEAMTEKIDALQKSPF